MIDYRINEKSHVRESVCAIFPKILAYIKYLLYLCSGYEKNIHHFSIITLMLCCRMGARA